jgi:hypothetical protein
MSNTKKPLSRKDNLVVQELNGEVLIYDLRTNKALCLNETSSIIWAACDGTRDMSAIRDYAAAKMNSPVNDDLVWLALDQFKKEKLIKDAPEAPRHFAGMSRREVVKTIGLTAAIALPLVAGLVAPPAANATSACTGGGCTCSATPGMGTVCPTNGAGGVPCSMVACQCIQTNNGNAAGTCQ